MTFVELKISVQILKSSRYRESLRITGYFQDIPGELEVTRVIENDQIKIFNALKEIRNSNKTGLIDLMNTQITKYNAINRIIPKLALRHHRNIESGLMNI
jgi:hypothetical protein